MQKERLKTLSIFVVTKIATDKLQQFAFKPATNKNIKPIVGLRSATLLVVSLINNCYNS